MQTTEKNPLHVSRGEVAFDTNPNAKAENFGEVDRNLAIEAIACAVVDAEIARLHQEMVRLKKLKGLIKDHELKLRTTFSRSNSNTRGHADLVVEVVNPTTLDYQALIADTFPVVHEPILGVASAA